MKFSFSIKMATNDTFFPPWQGQYDYFNDYSGYGFSSTLLLANKWGTYPALADVWVTVNIIQMMLLTTGVGINSYFLHRAKDAPGANYVETETTTQTVRILLVINPFLTMTWLLITAGINTMIGLGLEFSAPVAGFILIHALLEFAIIVLRILVIINVDQQGLLRVKYILIAIGGALAMLSLTTNDIYYRLAFSGIALISDIGNIIVSPIMTWKICKLLNNDTSRVKTVEILGMIFSYIHFLIYYPTAIMTVYGYFELAGSFMTVFTLLNLILEGYYIYKSRLRIGDNKHITYVILPV